MEVGGARYNLASPKYSEKSRVRIVENIGREEKNLFNEKVSMSVVLSDGKPSNET
ncbi:hypothetical protein RUM44_001534 [Polyplax serrata]|uniref:Uncharacterized protein n=1 Tax=Polyplax serrata TaxID=468196 RepID=A0ABR1AL01_POLSC